MKKISALRAPIAAFLLMMAMAVTTSALSFFVSPVCSGLDIGRGSFTLYYSMMTVSSVISTSFLGQYINKKGVSNILFISGLWTATGLMLFSFAGSLWVFYAVALCMGFFCSGCMNLCANVIVQQAYSDSNASGVLGIVMAGSGVGGMLFSLIVPGILEAHGWRIGYRFLSVCWLVLVLTAWLLLGKQSTSGNIGTRKTPLPGMTRAEALRNPRFYLVMVAYVLLTACCGIQQQIPSLLEGLNFQPSQVGVMVSVMTAGLAVGKIVQGILYGKIGIERGGSMMVVLFAAGFLLLLTPATAYLGLVCLAFGMGTVTTLMPTVARYVFGPREYASIWSVLATAGSIGSFVVTPLWGVIYDGFGSYTPGLIASPVLVAIALVSMLTALRNRA